MMSQSCETQGHCLAKPLLLIYFGKTTYVEVAPGDAGTEGSCQLHADLPQPMWVSLGMELEGLAELTSSVYTQP